MWIMLSFNRIIIVITHFVQFAFKNCLINRIQQIKIENTCLFCKQNLYRLNINAIEYIITAIRQRSKNVKKLKFLGKIKSISKKEGHSNILLQFLIQLFLADSIYKIHTIVND
ncbi:unnamed protein product [Paramecium primaurelia]|uniref:Transmembrane protein n=1 Tax=Paramecium primaurelia TaxID=5886 RepID=A0A8S1PBG8_PARPR|nr:unnamed protein product [Paramecium primaurelia]